MLTTEYKRIHRANGELGGSYMFIYNSNPLNRSYRNSSCYNNNYFNRSYQIRFY